MGQIKNIKLHIVTDIKWANKMREDMSKVYVGGLQNNVTDPDLYDAFEKYGAVESVTIIKDRESGDSRGFGFVQFDSENSADKAISAAASDKGIKVKGELCTVEFPRPKPADGFRGGFRGRGYDRFRGGRGGYSSDRYNGGGGRDRYDSPPPRDRYNGGGGDRYNSGGGGDRYGGPPPRARYDSPPPPRGPARGPDRFDDRSPPRYSRGGTRGYSRGGPPPRGPPRERSPYGGGRDERDSYVPRDV